MIAWWLQLKEATSLTNYKQVEQIIRNASTENNDALQIIWDTPMPTKISWSGSNMPPAVMELLVAIKAHLEEYEYMIFVLMVDKDIYSHSDVVYYMVSKYAMATIDGAVALENVRKLVLQAEDDFITKTLDKQRVAY